MRIRNSGTYAMIHMPRRAAAGVDLVTEGVVVTEVGATLVAGLAFSPGR